MTQECYERFCTYRDEDELGPFCHHPCHWQERPSQVVTRFEALLASQHSQQERIDFWKTLDDELASAAWSLYKEIV
jgi:hypothetical protein